MKDAWILNYTNPAAIVAVALKEVFPKDNRILNICDQPENYLLTRIVLWHVFLACKVIRVE